MRRSFPPPPQPATALVLRAHPRPESFNDALADAWIQGAQGLDVRELRLHELDFEPRLSLGDQPLEPDLVRAQQEIARAAHLVFAFPVWWSSTPASLKGFFDRVLLTGWAYRSEGKLPEGGLKGRTGRLLITMDSPSWYDRLAYGRAATRQVQHGVLRFCGVSAKASAFHGIEHTTPAQRETMLRRAEALGRRDAQRLRSRQPKALAASQVA